MARGGKALIFLQILTVLLMLFFGITTINTLDRNRREIAELKAVISAIPRNINNAAVTAAPVAGTACSNAQYFDSQAQSGGTLTTPASSDVGSLNPVTGNEATASNIIGMCTSALATRDLLHPEKFTPLLAESWQVSENGKRINIKLRKNVLWHDFVDPDTQKHVPSRIVTAHDFVFYADVIRNKKVNAGALRSYFQDLASIKAVNDHELALEWKNEYFRSLEMSLSLIPLPRHFYCPDGSAFDPEKFNYDHKRNDMIVGCGPYKLLKHERDQRFVLKRFDNYFGNALGIAPPVENRIIEIVKADNTRFQMLRSGKLDMLTLTPEQWSLRTQSKPFSKHVLTTGEKASDHPLQPGENLRRAKYLANAYFYIGYNLRNELFADKRVRQALTMLCNREKILNTVYYGQGRIISGPFFCNSPYYDKSIQPLPFSLELAKQKLAEANWRDSDGDGILDRNGKKFVFTALQVSGNALQERILAIFKEDLAKVGIDMKIVPLEWPVYIDKLEKRQFEVCSLGWSLPYESDPYQVWHSSQISGNGSNHIGFANAEADRLIEDIRKTLDTEKRIRLCHKLHKLLHEEQPYTFLLVPESLNVFSGKLQNLQVFPLGVDLESVWLKQF